MDVIATAAFGSQTNTWVFGYNGIIKSGWPQLSIINLTSDITVTLTGE